MYLSSVRAFLWSSSRNWARYVLRRDRPGFSMNTWVKHRTSISSPGYSRERNTQGLIHSTLLCDNLEKK